MTALVLLASARAADLAAFAGVWGLDPARSDDPTQAIDAALTGPVVTAGDAGRLSPDAQGEDPEELRTKLLTSVHGLLAASGTLSLAPVGGTVTLSYGGDATVALATSGGWAKLARDGRDWKVRLREDGDRLRIERREGATHVVETLLPRPAGEAELVVVVYVDGTGLEPGVEFRRVYRPLEPR